MPNIYTAKEVAEQALRVIGRLSPKQPQADAADLRVALSQLEMAINDTVGRTALAGFSRTMDIPLVSGQTVYKTSDYADGREVQQVFSMVLVEPTINSDPDPLLMVFENQALTRSPIATGTPCDVVVSRDVYPIITLLRVPTDGDVVAGRVLRLRYQTYVTAPDPKGIADTDIMVRPSWYLWLVTKVAYLCGRGPILRLPNGELSVLRQDLADLEAGQLARDGLNNTSQPPMTEPYDF
jgi:hypothetical protein